MDADAKRQQIINLPKVELHLHLEGSIRLSTLAEISDELNLEIPDNTESNKANKGSRDLTPYRNYFCIPEGRNVENINYFFQNFMHTQSVIYSEKVIERITFEACEDAYNNGVKLLEIRYSPCFIMLTTNPKIDHSKMTFVSIYNAVSDGLQKAQAMYDIAVGLIGIFDRTVDANKQIPVFHHFYDECELVHAIDLAADESFSCLPFIPFYTEEILMQKENTNLISEIDAESGNFTVTNLSSFSKTKSGRTCTSSYRFGKTCHAGESTTSQSVYDAVTHLNVTRIGHGFLSISDDNLINELIEKQIHLEICPVSNIRTGSVKDISIHPIRSLFDRGVSLSINSDDPGIFDSSIIDDYELCMDHHNFTFEEFYICNKRALNASFLPHEIKERIRVKYFNDDCYNPLVHNMNIN